MRAYVRTGVSAKNNAGKSAVALALVLLRPVPHSQLAERPVPVPLPSWPSPARKPSKEVEDGGLGV